MRAPGLTTVLGIVNVGVMIVAAVALLVLPFGGEEQGAPPVARSTPVTPSPAPSATASPATPESARKVRANELGQIPVIMYHRILKKRLASIDRTPAQLRKELERLATHGYVPITAAEFTAGAIDLPAGAHPVVLTFDDGHSSHFALDAAGVPKKDTAVGVIYEVAARHPGFRPVATFWVNKNPFGLTHRDGQAAAVRWLVDRGFEVANHTWGHPDLRRLSKKRVVEAIGRQERLLRGLGAPDSATFALPYGSVPKKRAAARSGTWKDLHYRFRAVFLAGAEPAVSPYAKTYDPFYIPRIQSNGKKGECRKWCSQYWLQWLDRHPDQRYTSDGDPTHVSMPRRVQGKIQAKLRGVKIVY
ncbi:xylanase [Sphaerisporangium melleum]|uniref:Xylanase n=1 Tax=Sphaerisporangium melleum TaxID=321316 RepID=A0A917VSQ7_9ACTN|nr:polysaccharide deacetylase family protein [Sphaerisporangium melleum]GGL10397.1 xylanase [Sphaerisporangium melleum]GII70742.1 xylanase [Sphaerisporangium melleum]